MTHVLLNEAHIARCSHTEKLRCTEWLCRFASFCVSKKRLPVSRYINTSKGAYKKLNENC